MIKFHLPQQNPLTSRLLKVFYFFISWLMITTADANGLKVTPTRLTLSPKQPIVLLYLTNPNAQPIVVQLQLKRWRQTQGENIFSTTHDILTVPPIFRLPPHRTQLIRLAWQSSQPLTQEKEYRLFIREVAPLASIKPYPSFHQLRILLRLSLPVFVTPTTPPHDTWQWTIQPLSNHSLQLTLHNQGDRTLLISSYQLNDALLPLMNTAVKTFAYVLPDESHHWQLSQSNESPPHTIEAMINHHMTYSDIHVLS